MRDRIWIVAGLALFVALVTAPIWSARGRGLAQAPNLTMPAHEKQCVLPSAQMRSEHMQLLVSWREDVVRRGDRQFTAFNGKIYEKSLTRTCLGCHNKQEFCDRCHEYAGVSGPYCWNCHSEPRAAVARSAP